MALIIHLFISGGKWSAGGQTDRQRETLEGRDEEREPTDQTMQSGEVQRRKDQDHEKVRGKKRGGDPGADGEEDQRLNITGE